MDGKAPLVSFIISTYNCAPWIAEAIDSVKQQTYTNWECIIIDDCSNDGTKQYLETLINDKRFNIIYRTENYGLTKNLNYGLSFCNGAYIARMDADDVCMPHRIATQVAYLAKNANAALVASTMIKINEANEQIGLWDSDINHTTPSAIKQKLPAENCLVHPSVLIKKNIFDQFKYNELQKNSQDWDLWMQLAANNYELHKIKEPLLYYRILPTSVTSTSLKQSAFLKKHNVYKNYLRSFVKISNLNWFNTKVIVYFCFNYIKLTLSKIKRWLST